MDLQELAKVVLEAQKIRDDSFDEESFKNIVEMEDREQDLEAFYDKTLYESADMAVTEAGFGLRELQLVFILLSYSWSDVKLWAETAMRDEIPNEAA